LRKFNSRNHTWFGVEDSTWTALCHGVAAVDFDHLWVRGAPCWPPPGGALLAAVPCSPHRIETVRRLGFAVDLVAPLAAAAGASAVAGGSAEDPHHLLEVVAQLAEGLSLPLAQRAAAVAACSPAQAGTEAATASPVLSTLCDNAALASDDALPVPPAPCPAWCVEGANDLDAYDDDSCAFVCLRGVGPQLQVRCQAAAGNGPGVMLVEVVAEVGADVLATAALVKRCLLQPVMGAWHGGGASTRVQAAAEAVAEVCNTDPCFVAATEQVRPHARCAWSSSLVCCPVVGLLG